MPPKPKRSKASLMNSGEDILYGIHPVAEAFCAGRRTISELIICSQKPGAKIRELIDQAKAKNIPLTRQKKEAMNRLTGPENHQGVAARVSPYPAVDWAELIMAPSGPFIFLLLDSIADPQNLGALIRTALCVGVKAVVIPKDRSAGPTPAVSKASAGALEHIALARVSNLVYIMKDLKKIGAWITGLEAAARQSIYAMDFTGTAAIVIGGEAGGLRPLVRRECDFLAHIPMAATAVNSLNAAVAGGVVLYEAFRQQGAAAKT